MQIHQLHSENFFAHFINSSLRYLYKSTSEWDERCDDDEIHKTQQHKNEESKWKEDERACNFFYCCCPKRANFDWHFVCFFFIMLLNYFQLSYSFYYIQQKFLKISIFVHTFKLKKFFKYFLLLFSSSISYSCEVCVLPLCCQKSERAFIAMIS